MSFMSKIRGIQFEVYSTSEIQRVSVCEITTPDTLRSDGIPIKNGVLDPRMGVDSQGVCSTCGQGSLYCNGHYGHIMLPPGYPLYNMMFRSEIVRVLNTICSCCFNIMLCEQTVEKIVRGLRGYSKLTALQKACASASIKECDVCSTPCVFYSWQGTRNESPKLVRSSVGEENVCVTSANAIYGILDRITQATAATLGFPTGMHPRDLMNTCILVIPPQARSGVTIDEYRAEEDVTVKYIDIIKTIISMKECIENGHPTHIIEDLHAQLQGHWSTLQKNDNGTSVTKGGRATKSLVERNAGKTGRMRVNIQGKRVNNSARTVISGDPNLLINEVGIPRSVASTLVVIDAVNNINRNTLQQYVDDGHVNTLIRNGRIFDINIKRANGKPVVLVCGDKVERHLMNGDVILFNRQPTLHRQGLMAMHARILPHSTFRMNLAATTGYNADFDGDEMNAYAPLSIEARVEAEQLMLCSRNVVSAAASKNVISIIQDSLLLSSEMSRGDIFIHRDDFFQLCVQLGMSFDVTQVPSPAKLDDDGRPLWTGKQALSLCLPKGLSARVGGCVIANGHLLEGMYTKKSLGTSRGGVVHRLHMHFGHKAVMHFLDRQQQLSNEFAIQHGASVGIGDCVIPTSVNQQVNNIILSTQREISTLLGGSMEMHKKGLPPDLERKVNALLNSCRDQAGILVQENLHIENNLLKMIRSGSKGSAINIAQISACVGQQNVDGRRIVPQFEERTLPHFKRGDFGDAACGFIANPYLSGLNPIEFFFHAKAGREGLCDTALRTSESGYMQRRCIKAMEDLVVKYDGTVRDSDKRVVQFVYGEDGFDATMLERHSLPTLDMLPQYANCLEHELKQLQEDMEATWQSRTNADIMLPIDIDHVIDIAITRWHMHVPVENDIHAMVGMVDELLERLNAMPGGLTHTCRLYIRSRLCSVAIAQKKVISIDILAYALRCIELAYVRGRVHAGEAVGILAAQSLGEPMTQSTLNTFHSTGISSMRATTQGLPRFRELLGATENPQTPSISAPLNDGVNVKHVQRKLDHMTIGQVTNGSKWPIIKSDMDVDFMCVFPFPTITLSPNMLPPDAISVNDTASVFIVCDKNVLQERAFTTDNGTTVDPVCYIAWRIEKSLGLYVCAGDANMEEPCFVVRAHAGSVYNSPAMLERAVLATTLHGTEGVTDVRRRIDETTGEIILDMFGTSMLRVMGDENVRGDRVTSNHVREVWRTLGVEAARATLVAEMCDVIESGGSSIDKRHVFLVCDLMTLSGDVVAVSRYGTNRSGRGPITRSSFEQTTETLLDAAKSRMYDNVGGVSDRIFLGQRCSIGTGTCTSYIDMRMYDADSEDGDGIMMKDDNDEEDDTMTYDPFANIPDIPFASGRVPMDTSYVPPDEYVPGAAFANSANANVYSPTSPVYSPTSPVYSPTSPVYSPTSPVYSPTSPVLGVEGGQEYSPKPVLKRSFDFV